MPEYGRKSVRLILQYACLLLVCLLPAAVAAQKPESEPTNTVTVIGSGPIVKKNMASAREQAIAAGMAAGVRQFALTHLSTEAIAGDFKGFNTALSGPPDEFVDNYKVLAEVPFGKTFRVMLQIKVSAERLKAKLAKFEQDPVQAEAPPPPPKILFLLAEQNLRDLTPEYWWKNNDAPLNAHAEKAIGQKLKEAGFEVLAHGHHVPESDVEAAIIFQPDLDNREALSIGKHLQADIVIVGKAIVYKVPDSFEDEVPSFSGTVTARAIAVSTGEEVASVLETVVRKNSDDAQGGQDALAAAGELAGRNLIPNLERMKQASKTPAIELAVTGTQKLGNFIRFRRSLSAIGGVEKIEIQEMRGNEALIRVRFKAGTDRLAEALKAEAFDLFDLNISKVTEDRLQVDLIPR